MAAAIIIGFLLAVAVAVWAAIVALSGRTPTWVRILYFGCFSAAAITAYFTTFHYIHYANANTRFHGWPIPSVVFQRDSPTSPWLDFVGPTVVLAYPMNLLLFVLLPSIVVLVLARRSRPQAQPNVA